MSACRVTLRLCLALAWAAAACARPSPEPTASPVPSLRSAATLALPPISSPTPGRTPTPSPGPIPERQRLPFPYLPPDLPLRLTRLDMVDDQQGWAIHQSEEGTAHVLRTSDGGFRWADRSPPQSVPADDQTGRPRRFRFSASFLDAQHAWVSLSDESWPGLASVWRTLDGGSSWEQAPLGRRNFGLDWITFDFVDPLHGWAVIDVFHGAGSHSGEAFRTTDGGLTWERLLGDFGYASGLDFVDRQVGWISTDVFPGVSPPWGLWITRDGGLSWSSAGPDLMTPIPEAGPGHRECGFTVLRVQSAQSGVALRLNCPGEDPARDPLVTSWLDFTSDAGRTWQSARMPSGPPEFIDATRGWVIGPSDPRPGEPPSSWSLFATVDGGRTWLPIRELPWQGELDFLDGRIGWGLDEAGGLHRTLDAGATWEDIPARSIGAERPRDATVTFQLPAEPTSISPATAPNLRLLATLPASDPTSLVIFRNTLYVGNAQGQILHWALGPALPAQPAIWRVHADWVYDLAAVDQGGDLVSASRDGLLRLWPLFGMDGYWLDFPIHAGEVLSAALSPDGMSLASGGEDATVKVQSIPGTRPAQLELDLRGHRGWIWDLVFSDDGSLLASASGDRTVKLWSAESGALLATLEGHHSTVSQVAFAPGGGQLASASWDGTVRIWDSASHEQLHTLQGHDDWVLGLAYLPAGNVLASASADGRVLLWDAAHGELIAQLLDLAVPVRRLAFDAQGRYLAAVADDDQVRLWGSP